MFQGTITHIQRMSLHDGPGIRTTIFFKGCNMRCRWCHNPETLVSNIETGLAKSKCIHCGVCLEKCPQGALFFKDGEIVKNFIQCTSCGTCIDECCARAHYLIGTVYSVDDLCTIVEEDRGIFELSGGGVTLSGGEPTVQYPFLKALAQALHARGFHITLQTNLGADWEKYAALLPFIHHFMCDFKLLDAEAHRYWTGRDNRLVLENIQKLDVSEVSYRLRTPVIPGVNASRKQLQQMSNFVSRLIRMEKYELIPFHRLASYKYENLGLSYEFEKVKEISGNEFSEIKEMFEINR